MIETIPVNHPPWDQRAARYLVRPLARTSITPNQVTIATLLIAVGGASLPALLNWGAGIFVVARFLDHCDGELVRQTNQTSRLGYYLDYFAEMVSYPSFTGFELEDGIYLIAPITWFGWLDWFFAAAGAGAIGYMAWTFFTLAKPRSPAGIKSAGIQLRPTASGESGSGNKSRKRARRWSRRSGAPAWRRAR
jgi:hypothetical protein